MTDPQASPGGRTFLPGLDLAEAFYREAVGPILDRDFPGLRHTAALIGPGSEVLGFDTVMSTDHGWGPRMLLFLPEAAQASSSAAISHVLSQQLPKTFRGYPTNFSEPDPPDEGSPSMCPAPRGPIRHRVEVHSLRAFLESYLGVDIAQPLRAEDWLLLPQQKLRSITAGRIFRDDLDLEGGRRRLAWYPHDVWLYLLASGWSRIGEEEHLMGRAGIAGDELGSAIIASRLVRDVVRLAFLMERVYAPYAKWLGTAFDHLGCADALRPPLADVMRSPSWEGRDAGLAAAYAQLAAMHNDLRLTPARTTRPTAFFDRPFQVIGGEHFAAALVAAISGGEVENLAKKRLIGNIDFVSDNTDLLEDPERIASLRGLYQ